MPTNVADTVPPVVYLSGGTAVGQALLRAATVSDAAALLAPTPEPNIAPPDAPTVDNDVEARTTIGFILDLLVAQGLMEPPG